MKTKFYSLLALAGMTLMLGSCSDDPDYPVNPAGQTGGVDLSDLGVLVDRDEIVISRADDPTVDTSDYLIRIVNAEGEVVYNATASTCNEIVTLPVADGYKVQVHSHEVENAAWSAPYYYGEKAFDVKANDITAVGNVNCKFSNVRVTVRYTDRLLARLNGDASVIVKCSENGSELEYVQNESRSGYFKALDGSTTLGAEFSGTISGKTYTYTKALNDVQGGQHRVVTFDVKAGNNDVPGEVGEVVIDGEGEGVKLADGLWLTVDVTNETVSGNVNVDEKGDSNAQRPGKEEGSDDPNPPTPVDTPITITAAGMKFIEDPDGAVMNPSDVTDGKVLIKAEKGIENLFVEIVPGGAAFEEVLTQMEVPLNFDLAHTKDATEREAMQGFQFPVDEEIVGKTEVPFDITTFVPLLSAYAGEPKFILTVVDSEGNRLSRTLSFIVVK